MSRHRFFSGSSGLTLPLDVIEAVLTDDNSQESKFTVLIHHSSTYFPNPLHVHFADRDARNHVARELGRALTAERPRKRKRDDSDSE